MTRSTMILVAAASAAVLQSQSNTPSPTSGQPAAVRNLNDYYRAFSSLDVQAILPYFHEPCMIIGPQGVFAASNRSVVATAFAPAMNALKARGFGRSELSIREIKTLSPTSILATGVAVRYKVDGSVLERVGVTYVLQKTNLRWEIAVLITHDANEGELGK